MSYREMIKLIKKLNTEFKDYAFNFDTSLISIDIVNFTKDMGSHYIVNIGGINCHCYNKVDEKVFNYIKNELERDD